MQRWQTSPRCLTAESFPAVVARVPLRIRCLKTSCGRTPRYEQQDARVAVVVVGRWLSCVHCPGCQQDVPGISHSTRNVGVMFGPDITKSFADRNGLRLIIRSHECVQSGIRVSGKDLVCQCQVSVLPWCGRAVAVVRSGRRAVSWSQSSPPHNTAAIRIRWGATSLTASCELAVQFGDQYRAVPFMACVQQGGVLILSDKLDLTSQKFEIDR